MTISTQTFDRSEREESTTSLPGLLEPDSANYDDGFGHPYKLFPDEARAVQDLYARAVDLNLEVYSVFELAQIAITSNLNLSEGIKRLKSLRKFEKTHDLEGLGMWDSVCSVLKTLETDQLFCAPFVDDQMREVLVIDATDVNFRKLATSEDTRKYLHLFQSVSFNMITDLRNARRGITIMAPLNKVKMKNMNSSLTRKQVGSGTGVFPLKIKKLVCVDVSITTRAIFVLAKRLIGLFNPKLANRFTETTSKRLAALFPSETLPKKYGGECEGFDFLESLQNRCNLREKAYAQVTCPNVSIERKLAPYDMGWGLPPKSGDN